MKYLNIVINEIYLFLRRHWMISLIYKGEEIRIHD